MIIINIEYRNKNIYVTGDTGLGIVRGVWYYRDPPIWGEMYFFELDIEELDRKEISILYKSHPVIGVNYQGGKVNFVGVCENIDDIYTIRFAEDWIEMLSIKDDDFSITEGDFISFGVSCKNIGIYPYS